MKSTLAILTLTGLLSLSTGCQSSGKPLDLLSLTMTERASDVIDPGNDAWNLRINTAIDPGTLHFNLTTTQRFNLGGVPLPEGNGDDILSGSQLRFILYSDAVMQDLIEFVNAGNSGAQFGAPSMPSEGPFPDRIAAAGAIDRFIGMKINNYRDKAFMEDATAAIIERFGPGTFIQGDYNMQNSQYWKVDERYIFVFPAYSEITILAASQLYEGCMLVSGPGVIDIEGCDEATFSANFPANVRTRPTE